MTTESRGWIIPELVIADALQAGLNDVAAAFADNSIDDLLTRIYFNVDPTRRAKIKEMLGSADIPILFNYPQTQQTFPCWVVVTDPEAQNQFLGDISHDAEFLGGGIGIMTAEKWESTVGVITYTEHPETLIWYYHLSKWILASRRSALDVTFPLKNNLSGRNLGFDARFLPRFVYHRVLQAALGYQQYDAQREVIPEAITAAATNMIPEYAHGLGGL